MSDDTCDIGSFSAVVYITSQPLAWLPIVANYHLHVSNVLLWWPTLRELCANYHLHVSNVMTHM